MRQELLQQHAEPGPQGLIGQHINAGFDVLVRVEGLDAGLGEHRHHPSMPIRSFGTSSVIEASAPIASSASSGA